MLHCIKLAVEHQIVIILICIDNICSKVLLSQSTRKPLHQLGHGDDWSDKCTWSHEWRIIYTANDGKTGIDVKIMINNY